MERRLAKQGQDFAGRFQQRGTCNFFLRGQHGGFRLLAIGTEEMVGACQKFAREMAQQVADNLAPFGEKDLVSIAILLQRERADVFLLILGKHLIYIIGLGY